MMEAKFLDEGLKEEFRKYGVIENEEADTIIYKGTTANWHGIFDSMCYMPYGDKDCLMIDALRLKTEEIMDILKNRCRDVEPECKNLKYEQEECKQTKFEKPKFEKLKFEKPKSA